MPRVTPEDPKRTLPHAANRTVLANGQYRIGTASWREAATATDPRAQEYLVQADTADHNPGGDADDMTENG